MTTQELRKLRAMLKEFKSSCGSSIRGNNLVGFDHESVSKVIELVNGEILNNEQGPQSNQSNIDTIST